MWIINETPSNLCFKYLQQRGNHLPWPHIHVITTWLLANSSSYRVYVCLPQCHNPIRELLHQKQCLNYSTGPFSKGFTACQLGPGTVGTTWTKTNSSHKSHIPLLLTPTRNINSTWCLLPQVIPSKSNFILVHVIGQVAVTWPSMQENPGEEDCELYLKTARVIRSGNSLNTQGTQKIPRIHHVYGKCPLQSITDCPLSFVKGRWGLTLPRTEITQSHLLLLSTPRMGYLGDAHSTSKLVTFPNRYFINCRLNCKLHHQPHTTYKIAEERQKREKQEIC